MSIELRIILIIVSVFTTAWILRKIRKSMMQIEDSLFWIVLSLTLIIISIFPIIPIYFARLIGVESPVNLVFLVFIFILLMKIMLLAVKISMLEEKIKDIVGRQAIEHINCNANEKNEKGEDSINV